METPRTVDEFVAETTRQAVKDTATLQEAFRRYLDEAMDANRAYLAAWAAVQQAGLRVAFDLQNAMVQASRSLFESGVQANQTLLGKLAESAQQMQATTGSVVAAWTKLAEASLPGASE